MILFSIFTSYQIYGQPTDSQVQPGPQKIERPALAGTISTGRNDVTTAIKTPTSTCNDLQMKSPTNLNDWEKKDDNAVVDCKYASAEYNKNQLSETDTAIRNKDAWVRLKSLEVIIFLMGILIWKSSHNNKINWA